MVHDTLDHLAEVLVRLRHSTGQVPGLLKADVDSAFRRIPVDPTDDWACGVAFVANGAVYCSQHKACPFGATASVHAWERIGAAIAHLARTLLMLPVLRYVDDFFAADRPDCLKVGLDCLARLIRLILGPDAVAPHKLECGEALEILGIDVSPTRHGFTFRPAADKVPKWLQCIETAISDQTLSPGDASKLAGRLAWGGSRLFHRIGRAMLRPIFDQVSRYDGKFNPELKAALRWWRDVLLLGTAELRPWWRAAKATAHLFTDASGAKRQLGAVLYVDGCWFWSSMVTPPRELHLFRRRRDNQIMGLELLGVAFGMSTFESLLSNRNVVIHCDNSGAEAR